jgi:hypothetical protein
MLMGMLVCSVLTCCGAVLEVLSLRDLVQRCLQRPKCPRVIGQFGSTRLFLVMFRYDQVLGLLMKFCSFLANTARE